MPVERSAGAVIYYRQGKKIEYLLLQYLHQHWDSSRGHVEDGETDMMAAQREIREETGLDNLKFLPGFKKEISWFYKKKGLTKASYKEAVYFLAPSKTKKIKISHESLDYKWVTLEHALKLKTFPIVKEVLKEAASFLAKPKF